MRINLFFPSIILIFIFCSCGKKSSLEEYDNTPYQRNIDK